MNDAPEFSTESRRWVGPVVKIVGAIYLLAGLPFFFVFIPILRGIRRGASWTDAGMLSVVIAVLIGMPMLLAAGVGLLKKSSWSLDLARLAALVPVLATFIDFANSQDFEIFWITALVAPPGLFFAAILSVAPIREELSQQPDTTFVQSLKPLFRNVMLLVVGVLVLGLTLSEMPDIVSNLKMSRWQSQCEESGDHQACGRYAQSLIQRGRTMEDWKAGLEGMNQLCRRGNSFACRKYGYLHSYTDTDDLKSSAQPMVDHLDSVARKTCNEGDGRGCFVVKARHLRATQVIEEHDVIRAKATELCQNGDVWACRAVFHFAMDESGDHPVPDEYLAMAKRKLCEGGFVLGCRGLDLNNSEDFDLAGKFCDAHPSSDVCLEIGEFFERKFAVPGFYQRSCEAGLLPACEKAIGALDEHPFRDVVEPLYRALYEAHRQASPLDDVGYWSVVPLDLPRERLEEACDAEIAEGCFALGLEFSKDRRDVLEPELGKVADYDVSFRKACELGFDPGCLAYAERLSNRPIGERRRLELAEGALQIACDRGHVGACWMIDVDDEIIDGDFDTYEKRLEQACRHQPTVESFRVPCRELAYFWAWKLEATPWLFSERRTRALSREHCIETGKWSCAQVTWMRAQPHDSPLTTTSPPWHVEEFTSAKKSCKHLNLWSCKRSFKIARQYPAVSEETVAEFKESVCEVLPDVDSCEEAE